MHAFSIKVTEVFLGTGKRMEKWEKKGSWKEGKILQVCYVASKDYQNLFYN